MALPHDLIKRVVHEQVDEARNHSKLAHVSREGFAEASKQLTRPWIKAIMGVRRCGKSSFCHQLLRGKTYGYINFDDERLVSLKVSDLDSLLRILLEVTPDPQYLLLDEIQNVKGWELFANRLHRQGHNLLITGSNSKLLSHDLATHLTGRHVSIELFPFSFSEYLEAKSIQWNSSKLETAKIQATILRNFETYAIEGGFPEMVVGGYDAHYLRELYDKIIGRDIVDRYSVKYGKTLREIALYAFSNLGSKVSYHKIRKTFELSSVHTVKNYLQYLEHAYLLTQVPAHSFKVKEQLRQARKLYTIDNGMTKALSLKHTEDRGAHLENLVHQELKRRTSETFYWTSDSGSSEVDFAVKKGLTVDQLIQVSMNISDPLTRARELKGLVEAAQATQCRKLLLLTWNETETIEQSKLKIRVMPVWRWLLE